MFERLTQKIHYALTQEHVIEATEKAVTKASYMASGATIISGLTINEWGVIVGMVIGIATFSFNVWFKMKYGRNEND